MARKLRIQYPGAVYHIINRGNYRRDLFTNAGEAKSFLGTLVEAKDLMGWRVYAYVLMRNHYHLVVETPEPNLVEGMHWLQSTWATRFNRFRAERGHLFQGRYQSLLIENSEALGRVIDYVHLNPVRAKVVLPEQVKAYRWSSLPGIVKGGGWVDDEGWRAEGRFGSTLSDRIAYENWIQQIGQDEADWEKLGLKGLSKGWAIGSLGWRQAIAGEFRHLALNSGHEREEVRELREHLWENTVLEVLRRLGRAEKDLITKPMRQDWKVEAAKQVREQSGASLTWLAKRLHLGKATTLRNYLWNWKNAKSHI